MGVLISSTDFTGALELPESNLNDLDDYIKQPDKEEELLIELLGANLYTDFKNDLVNGVPQSTKYLAIYNSFQQDYSGQIIRSIGMKEMLKRFIYFDYLRFIKYNATGTGLQANATDSSRDVGSQEGGLYNVLNKAIETYQAIQFYITVINSSDYNDVGKEFNGIKRTYSIPYL